MGYFEVNKIPFKVVQKTGFDSETGVQITRTRLLHSNQYNNVPSHNFNQGNAGTNFEVSILIRKEYLHEGRSYGDILEEWEKYQTVVNVVTNAFDVPNSKYTISIKNRKQQSKTQSIWKVEFYQHYENPASFGGAKRTYGKGLSSVEKTVLNAESTIDKTSDEQYIKALQELLIDNGYMNAGTKPTGKWSDELTQDITNFQKDQELKTTGVADIDTVSRITALDMEIPVIDPTKIVFGGIIK